MLQSEVQEMVNRCAIQSLLHRYAQALDDRSFTMSLKNIFTSDCVVDLPPGMHQGFTDLDKFHATVMAPFANTQHLITNHIIEISGDKASFRANTHVTHLIASEGDNHDSRLFVVGGVITGVAVLMLHNWMIQNITLVPIWRQGEGPGPDMKVG
ncbi:nuclear transport factor 2 family protein [Klebsiella variicola]|uniref:nuclear transport factor 2 family protein n=1 Tax=Klebsiella variicola TaxID=244366 RepID=UPI0015E9AE5D|nr:nuclear transport factor 2 family protein [Klebsiella variicola]QLS59454.1 nuclear transport factor 2 family protein [Klebsiella variicola]